MKESVIAVHPWNTTIVLPNEHKQVGKVESEEEVVSPEMKRNDVTDDESDTRSKDPPTTYAETELYTAIKPLLLTLKILGLYHTKCERLTSRSHQNNFMTKMKIPTLSQFYSWIILTMLIVNLLKTFSCFNITDTSALFATLQQLTWFLSCLINNIICLYASHRYQALPKFFIDCHSLTHQHGLTLNVLKVRRAARISTLISIMFYVCNMVFAGYLIWAMPSTMANCFCPLTFESEYFDVMRSLAYLIMIYNSAAWLFPIALDWVVCKILRELFEQFNERFRKNCNSRGACEICLGKARLDHQKLVLVTERADSFLSMYKASSLGTNILLVILILYNLLNDRQIRGFSVVIYTFWMVMPLGIMLLSCISGATVNAQAHGLLGDLQRVDTRDREPAQTWQLLLFAENLRGSSVGLTAMGLFLVDKGAILTIAGALLTYVVVILQFPSGSDAAGAITAACNCSEFLVNASLTCSLTEN